MTCMMNVTNGPRELDEYKKELVGRELEEYKKELIGREIDPLSH